MKTNTTINRPEIVFGIVGAIGSNMDFICEYLENALTQFDYSCETITLSSLMRDIKNEPFNKLPKEGTISEEIRIDKYMDAGDSFRNILGRGDSLVLLSLLKIRKIRRRYGSIVTSISNKAYILRSLKHPDEVKTLRAIYGSNFILIAAYSPREQRLDDLSTRIADSLHGMHSSDFRASAEKLLLRDEEEAENIFGQNVRETFPLADVFVNTRKKEEVKTAIFRFIDLIFNHPFHTPTKDEYAIFHASAAAARSASPQRQVGAVIANDDGDVIAVGTNEIAKAGGGQYWYGDTYDKRDHVDINRKSDNYRRHALADMLERLQKKGWLADKVSRINVDKLVDKGLSKGIDPFLKKSQVMNVIEYGRSVHAEMAAICDAAKRGVPIKFCILYTTTFPCHECARHIVAAGIKSVFYIEPYPKSLVSDLYSDSIVIDSKIEPNNNFVFFKPFVGIAPKMYMSLFPADGKRENRIDQLKIWEKSKRDQLPNIIESMPSNIIAKETLHLCTLEELLKKSKINLK